MEKLIPIMVPCTINNGKLVQVFDPEKEEINEEFCIHGIKLRWSCEYCEDQIEELDNEPKR